MILTGLLLVASALFAFEVLSRKPLMPLPSTTHSSLSRTDCLRCHGPIADEWRESYHYKSVTGPYWKDVRELGYLRIFDTLRKPCLNCHAPANVLDVIDRSLSSSSSGRLGVECSPNVFRNPRGVIPAVRADGVELGVDCTACHVSARGIMGSGRLVSPDHEVVADARFQNSEFTTATLCRVCHGSIVEAWKGTSLVAGGGTCLDCHMPTVLAPSVTGGTNRVRRSHRFPADKDRSMLQKALRASLEIGADRNARFRIRNTGTGHYLPSGGNWLSVRLEARDTSGRLQTAKTEAYGREEALLLDFWPFNADTRIAYGGQKEVLFPLPKGRGTLSAVVRYHDWIATKAVIVSLEKSY